MVTLCTATDVLRRAGVGANSSITASNSWIEAYITTAEGTIVAETRFDYVDNYSSVDTATKETLRICAAAHAAKEIIQYDMRGYFTRAEAITILNINENTFQRTLNALKNKDINSIRSIS